MGKDRKVRKRELDESGKARKGRTRVKIRLKEQMKTGGGEAGKRGKGKMKVICALGKQGR